VTQLSAEEIIALLELTPHPEGGHYRETFRDQNGHNGRAHGTAIYFLLSKASAPIGIVSMPRKRGIGTPARRWS
jgi:predicted cupin superfamily sugar epimerase